MNKQLETLTTMDLIEEEAEKQELRLAAKKLALKKDREKISVNELLEEILNIRNGLDQLYLRLKRISLEVEKNE